MNTKKIFKIVKDTFKPSQKRKQVKAELKALKCPTVAKTKVCKFNKSCDLNCERCPHNPNNSAQF